MMQSFDWSTLQLIQKEAPEIRTMYLSSPHTLRPKLPEAIALVGGLRAGSLRRLGTEGRARGGGRIWAPNQTSLTPALLAEARSLGLLVIPWTVNEPEMIVKLLDMGVDGIISDRPDLVIQERRKRGAWRGTPSGNLPAWWICRVSGGCAAPSATRMMLITTLPRLRTTSGCRA